MKWFNKINSMLSRKEKIRDEKIEFLTEELKSLNPPEKIEKREFTSGSTIHVKQTEYKRLSFDNWAKTIVNGCQDSSEFSELISEQLFLKGFKGYTDLENHVKLLWNLAGEPDSHCCRWSREVIEREGVYYLQCRLIVWRNLKTPPPKLLRDGTAIKLTNRGKTYDYVCKGESYHPVEKEDV